VVTVQRSCCRGVKVNGKKAIGAEAAGQGLGQNNGGRGSPSRHRHIRAAAADVVERKEETSWKEFEIGMGACEGDACRATNQSDGGSIGWRDR
jgi:hypothetical protein